MASCTIGIGSRDEYSYRTVEITNKLLFRQMDCSDRGFSRPSDLER